MNYFKYAKKNCGERDKKGREHLSIKTQQKRNTQNRFCLEVRGMRGRWRGLGAGGRNDPNNICTYE
jgi:hypothetical protein